MLNVEKRWNMSAEKDKTLNREDMFGQEMASGQEQTSGEKKTAKQEQEMEQKMASGQEQVSGQQESSGQERILNIENLDITFRTTAGDVHAIRGVDIDLYKGETVAIVGESGSGKSVTMKAAMGILASNATVTNGTIEFSYHHEDGTPETEDILKKDKKWIRRHINGKRIAMVFQDPMTSLDPTMNIGKQIMEGMIYHFKTPKQEAWDKAVALLKEVGIEDAEKRMKNYPHQLSGGMRQRVVIAIALSCNPDLLICDEPTTALDVSIQAQVVNLMKDIQQETNTAYLFIAHDLSMVKYISDRIGVLHLGHLLETGTTEEIFSNPIHPYTRSLLSAIPAPNPVVEKNRIALGYDYKTSGIDYGQGTEHLVNGTHYVKCTDEEFDQWNQ